MQDTPAAWRNRGVLVVDAKILPRRFVLTRGSKVGGRGVWWGDRIELGGSRRLGMGAIAVAAFAVAIGHRRVAGEHAARGCCRSRGASRGWRGTRRRSAARHDAVPSVAGHRSSDIPAAAFRR